jgi:hypothetical protein
MNILYEEVVQLVPLLWQRIFPKDDLFHSVLVRKVYFEYRRSRDSSVGIATDYGLDGRGSIYGSDKRFLSTPQRRERLWGPPASSLMGTGVSFSGVKRPRIEADYSPPSTAEAKNGRAIPPLPYAFMAWCLIKPRDSFTFTLF